MRTVGDVAQGTRDILAGLGKVFLRYAGDVVGGPGDVVEDEKQVKGPRQ